MNRNLVGYDRLLSQITKPVDTNDYLPFNVKQNSEIYALELAVAGFSDSEISIVYEPNKLTIEGESHLNSVDEVYVHKGIAKRKFKKVFTMLPTMIVKTAKLELGILTIVVENVIPEEMKPRNIPITISPPNPPILEPLKIPEEPPEKSLTDADKKYYSPTQT